MWCFPIFYELHNVGRCCDKIRDEADEIQRILRNNSENFDGKLFIIVEKFLLNSSHIDWQFTTNGFFNVNSSMLYNVRGFVVFKLII